MKKLVLHDIQEINKDNATFIKQNALIRPDGSFYIAKGYTGCNPWHQLESSALWVGRQDIGYDFVERYQQYLNYLKEKDSEVYKKYLENLRKVSRVIGATELYDKRSILVHFYGYTLFCRTELIKAFNDRDIFFDQSVVPNPDLYGREITSEQKTTLEEFFNINDGQNVSCYGRGERIRDKDEMLQLVLTNKNHGGRWHC
ncbi:MAG: hypothetical protein K2H20_04285 [Bacilli bacterium]|nr:hypothetical protein [Bacilli bacterium]